MFAPTVSLVVLSSGIRSLPALGKARAPRTPTALYPRWAHMPRLYLNTFRGEPAISKFDWNFSATHSSSEPFVTDTSSTLHGLLRPLQSDHGLLTWFRVYPTRLNALFRLAVAVAPRVARLTVPRRVTRRFILQKARRQLAPSTVGPPAISGSISLPSPGCFSPFPHGTVRYRS